MKDPKVVGQIVSNKNNMRYGLLFGGFVAIFQSIVCRMRQMVNGNEEYEKYVFLVAGFIGGYIAAFALSKNERQALALFLISRALDITYSALVRKGYISESKYFYVLVYSLSMVVTGYCFMNEPGSMSDETFRFYKKFINENYQDMQMRQILL